MMLSHTTLGSNNIASATAFYLEVLAPIGAKQIYQSDTVIFFEFERGDAKLAISLPFDGQPATNGNGTMVAFNLTSNELVDRVYDIAIKMGGTDEGKPGPRNDGNFYGAYFRDLDGNKIAIFHRA